jgi:hypothetical protein
MIGNWFLRFGALFGFASISLAIYAGYQHDTTFQPLLQPVTMAGWIGMFMAGLYYSSISTTSEYVETIGSQLPVTATLHFLCALLGAIALVAGGIAVIYNFSYTGSIASMAFDKFAWGEKVAFGGTVLTGVAQLFLLLNVLRGTAK